MPARNPAQKTVDTLRTLRSRIASLFSSQKRNADLEEELHSHIDLATEENLSRGLSPAEARTAALRRFGGLTQVQQRYREQQALPALQNFAQDLRFGMRMLAKNPSFAAIAILTLALGIGANTAVFSVVNAILLHPLPFPHTDELVTVHASKQNFAEGSISYPNFLDWQRDNKTLSALAVSRGTGFSLTGVGETEEIRAELVSSGFFSLLGVKPVLGRLFAAHEDEIGRPPIALISAGLWARKFGSRPEILGQPLHLDGRSYTVVGVLPADFTLQVGNFRAADIYVPIGQFRNPALKDRAAGLGIHGIARLKPGVTLAQAQADLESVTKQLEAEFPEDDKGIRARLVPFQYAMVREVKPLLLILFGAVGMVLLIACVNVANLLLARSNARTQEFAVRSALGASRTRMVTQLLTEGAILSLAGGLLGLAVAELSMHSILALLPQRLPRAEEIHLSAAVLCFTLLLSLLSGMLFSLVPALQAGRRTPNTSLKEGAAGRSGASHRIQDSLIVLQMALALVLLTGAGLLIRSMAKLSSVDPGFRPQGVFTFGLAADPLLMGANLDTVRAYLREVDRRISSVPGVTSASLSWAALPLISDDEQSFWLENEQKPSNQNDMHQSIRYIVGPGYLKTMGIPLLRGRFLSRSDDERAQRVIVVDDTFANKFFPHQDPIGKRIQLEQFDTPSEIVGIVGHVNQWGLDIDATNSLRAETYQALLQMPDVQLGLVPTGMDVIVQANTPTAAAFAKVKQAITAMNHEQVVYNVSPMEEVIADSLAARRFSMILLAVFAAIALSLACIGMYGVISYVVAQRNREIGIRMALGADRRNVLRWIMEKGGKLALIGAAIGVLVAIGVTHLMAQSSLLYGVHAFDPETLAIVTAGLLTVAFVACYIPARRATRIDPIQALRTD
jgi:predicted permease